MGVFRPVPRLFGAHAAIQNALKTQNWAPFSICRGGEIGETQGT